MTKINFSENNDLLNTHRSNPASASEPHISTLEALDEVITNCILSLTKQLEYLTQLMQRMSSVFTKQILSMDEYQC